jgi:hypothetical protein
MVLSSFHNECHEFDFFFFQNDDEHLSIMSTFKVVFRRKLQDTQFFDR